MILGALNKTNLCDLKRVLRTEIERKYSDNYSIERRFWGLENISEAKIPLTDITSQLLGMASEYYRAKSLCYTWMGNIVPAGLTVGSGGGWHCDSRLSPQIKFFIYLTDVTSPEDGAFECFTKKETALIQLNSGLRGNLSPRYEDLDVDFIRSKCRTILGSAGTVFKADTRVVHRGRPVGEGRQPRFALTLYVYGKNRPKDMDLTSIVL
jgi:hypothetical protein